MSLKSIRIKESHKCRIKSWYIWLNSPYPSSFPSHSSLSYSWTRNCSWSSLRSVFGLDPNVIDSRSPETTRRLLLLSVYVDNASFASVLDELCEVCTKVINRDSKRHRMKSHKCNTRTSMHIYIIIFHTHKHLHCFPKHLQANLAKSEKDEKGRPGDDRKVYL